jgi:hypothetical protein
VVLLSEPSLKIDLFLRMVGLREPLLKYDFMGWLFISTASENNNF